MQAPGCKPLPLGRNRHIGCILRIRRVALFAGCAWLATTLAPIAAFGPDPSGWPGSSAALHARPDARPDAIRISWNEVRGANAYLIQIRDADDEVVQDARVNTNFYTVRLQPGRYEQRVAAVNALGKAGPWSDWFPLKVRETREPLIRNLQTVGQPDENGEQRVEINGHFFTPDSRVLIRRPGLAPQEAPIESISSGKARIRVDPRILAAGDYTIVVENPLGRRTERPAVVRVTSQQEVVIPEEAREPTPEYRARERELAAVIDQQEEQESELDSDDGADSREAPFYTTLVPGWNDFATGDWTGAAVWGGVFAGGALFIGAEFQSGSNVISAYESAPVYNLFNNGALVLFLREGATQEQRLALSAVYLAEQNQARAAYQRHQQRQLSWAAVAGLVWATHFLWSNDWALDRLFSRSAPPPAPDFAGSGAAAAYLAGDASAFALSPTEEMDWSRSKAIGADAEARAGINAPGRRSDESYQEVQLFSLRF